MQILDGMLENGHELRQTKVRDFVHLGVDEDLEGSDCKGDVGRRRGNRQRIMERLAAQIRSVDCFDQVTARH